MRSADDVDEIYQTIQRNKKLKKIHFQHLCAIRNGLSSNQCWCYMMSEDRKSSLPCSQASDTGF
jgi:hypothetical protein